MRKFTLSILAAVLAGSLAVAQQRVFIQAENTDVSPGVTKNVAVDAQGRLKVVSSGGSSAPVACGATASKNTTVGTTTATVPATALTNRYYVRVCNSVRNTGSPIITCATSGTPTATVGSVGDTLEPGDCATYENSATAPITCISDTASTAVTTEECGAATN